MKILICSIMLIIAIITILVITFSKSKNSSKSLESFISLLKKYTSSLSTQCKPNNFDQIVSTINDIINKADALVKSANDNYGIDPVEIKAYKDIKQKISDLITSMNSLNPCNIDKCIQGTYDSDTDMCVCQDENYPVPIIVNRNLYCYSDNCSNYPNSSFQPSDTTDSSKNNCVCSAGYIKDKSLPFCYNQAETDTLNGYMSSLSDTTFPTGISGAIGKYKDFTIVEGVMGINNNTMGEISTTNTLKTCIDTAKTAGKTQVIFDGVRCNYGDFVNKTITDKVNCQSAFVK